ncbi:DUF4062 domain-containing protein [Egibacter rhizosphaerae]|uniref:DUF4062 domain-containing protein n=1 Tax=Egibacter rhizosphaerae TaxID=1670831 RepID=A0A411YCL5_9ACTN|nr:DUF4062 domain-containing protein [Egibacter rhizosphaerae]
MDSITPQSGPWCAGGSWRRDRGSRHATPMDVFISSVVGGYEAYRDAAADAVATLGHRVVRAEDFPATPGTPQQACLEAARQSDVVVLLLGSDYGAPQASGLSATHEEYREARERRPVLVFVESDVERDPAQEEFLREVQAWTAGHFRGAYSSTDELKKAVTRALHEHELATSAGPVDEGQLIARVHELLSGERGSTGQPVMSVAVAGGPEQQVVRPAELEDPTLARDLQREALFGAHPVLDAAEGTQAHARGHTLRLEQPTASVAVDEAAASWSANGLSKRRVSTVASCLPSSKRMCSMPCCVLSASSVRFSTGSIRFTGSPTSSSPHGCWAPGICRGGPGLSSKRARTRQRCRSLVVGPTRR